jgi:hypothetical protein
MADLEASVTSASRADGSGCASILALFECLEELRCPGDDVGALDTGARQNVVEWCLIGSCVGQKSPVDFHHARKPTELTGSLWRVAVLEGVTSSSKGWEPSADTL